LESADAVVLLTDHDAFDLDAEVQRAPPSRTPTGAQMAEASRTCSSTAEFGPPEAAAIRRSPPVTSRRHAARGGCETGPGRGTGQAQ
jgi:hypothetical protein